MPKENRRSISRGPDGATLADYLPNDEMRSASMRHSYLSSPKWVDWTGIVLG
jgi:hypothetical protein